MPGTDLDLAFANKLAWSVARHYRRHPYPITLGDLHADALAAIWQSFGRYGDATSHRMWLWGKSGVLHRFKHERHHAAKRPASSYSASSTNSSRITFKHSHPLIVASASRPAPRHESPTEMKCGTSNGWWFVAGLAVGGVVAWALRGDGDRAHAAPAASCPRDDDDDAARRTPEAR